MDLQLNGKRALVTGGSAGIGAATARRLAEEGCDVIIVARTRSSLNTVKVDIEASTGRQVDVAVYDLSCRGVADDLTRSFPDVDILVNCAGEDPTGQITEIDEERWRQAWDLKAFGYINMCRSYYRRMQQRGGGVIINVIGVAHLIRDRRYICGATSTAAITAFTQALGGSSMADGIRVVGVGPGVTATPRVLKGASLTQAYSAKSGGIEGLGENNLDEVADRVATGLGLTRSGRPEEVASLIAFASSPQAAYMSGTVVYTDGGWART